MTKEQALWLLREREKALRAWIRGSRTDVGTRANWVRLKAFDGLIAALGIAKGERHA